ncbi:MAG: type II CRISPR RNA-guided endonuclease Cas9 [Bacteroidia bacterium]
MIIGIDMGTNSLGWAVIGNKSIIETGVRVFPEGVNRPKGGAEESKNKKRREARQIRRQYFRRRLRLQALEKLLSKYMMFPDDSQRATWVALNPYQLRAKGVEEELTPLEFGRVLYHIAQRRGFKSSMKGKAEEEGKIYDGNLKINKIGITATQQGIAEGQYPTLGSYLNDLDTSKERIRNRYTTRQMYIHEFEVLWNVQKQFKSEFYSDELKESIGNERTGVLFFQRPLRSQKSLVGKCKFEPQKPKAPLSSIAYQDYRAWSFLNTLKYGNNEALTSEQKVLAFEEMSIKPKLTLKALKKKLKIDEIFNYEDDAPLPCLTSLAFFKKHFEGFIDFNEEKQLHDLWHLFYDAADVDWLRTKLQQVYGMDEIQAKKASSIRLEEGYASLSTLAITRILPFLEMGFMFDQAVLIAGVQKALGESRWNMLSTEVRNGLIDSILHVAKRKEKSKSRERIANYLQNEFGLDEKRLKLLYHHSDLEDQEDLMENLPEIRNLRNPVVQQSMAELRAVMNSIIKNHGKPDHIVVELARELKNSSKKREEIRKSNLERENQRNKAKEKLLKDGIRPTSYNITKYLLWEECSRICPYTGKSIGWQDLFDDGIWQIEHIIPYSISLDDSFMNKTLCYADENRRKGNKTPFQFYGSDETTWQEKKVLVKQLLCNRASYSKFLRFVDERDPIADDFLSRQLNDTRYMSKEAKSYLAKICKDVVVSPGSVTSQLRHLWGLNGILSPPIKTDFKFEGPCWIVTNETGEAVHLEPWSLDLVGKAEEKLSKYGIVWEGDIRKGMFQSKKERADHRHHAVDAIAIACTERRFVQQLSFYHSRSKEHLYPDFELPWPTFFRDAKRSVENILVVHKKRNRLITSRSLKQKINGTIVVHKLVAPRGQLHEETYYGRVHDPISNRMEFTTRKPLEAITKVKHIARINETEILKQIEERAKELNVDLKNEKATLPKNFFFESDENGMPIPVLYMPNRRNGKPNPIKKVRVRVESSNMALRSEHTYQYAEPGNNYLVAIIESDAGLREEMISFWTAVERKKQGLELIPVSQGERVKYTFQSNDLYFLGLPDHIDIRTASKAELSPYLYRVQKLSSMYYVFRHHGAATLDQESEMQSVQSFKRLLHLDPIKVKLDLLGRIV